MKINKLLLIVLCGLATLNVNAQFNTFLVPLNSGLETSNTIGNPNQCVSIGDVPALINVRAKLHVNSFGLALSTTGVGLGQMFRTDGPNNVVNSWTMYTGVTAPTTIEQLSIFSGLGANLNNMFFQATQGDMIFNAGGGFQRVRIVGVNRVFSPPNGVTTYPVRAGNVGIGTANPCVMLQIGGNVTVSGGYRDWMNVGTLYQFGSDNMYVGYKNTTGNAIINWGNNPAPSVPDKLLFVFTALVGGVSKASGINGLEIARMATDGNFGRTGFGGDPNIPNQNFYSSGTADPQNIVEINTLAPNAVLPPPPNTTLGFATANPLGGTGFSGLRFTDLTSASLAVTTIPTTNVLSVDQNGDVILIPGSPGSTFFAQCNALPIQTVSFGTLLLGANFYYEGNQSGVTTDNSVIIGNPCTYVPQGKLDVFQNSTALGTIGIFVENSDQADNVNVIPSIGIKSIVTNPFPNVNCYKIGGWFEATPTVNCNGSLDQYAIFTPLNGGLTSLEYALGTNPFVAQLEVNGDVWSQTGMYLGSDQSYKTNITPITNASDKLMRLNGVYFYWDTINNPELNLKTGRQVGFIAQNLDTVLPEVVITDANGKKSIDYGKVIALYAQGFKEQQAEIDTLYSLLDNNLRTSNSSSNNINIDLSSDIILYQNYPNPFGNETIIKYYIPTNVNFAKMTFKDETGRVIKEVDLTATGDGQITVNAQDLASGIYAYSLEVNGKNIQTRKMVKVN